MGPSLHWEQAELFCGALTLPMEFQYGAIDLFRGGRVRVGWDKYGLRVHAQLLDDSVYTGATANNQPTWRLGDVFEIFAKHARHDDYFELHMTPSGHRLQLHFPDGSAIEKIRDDPRSLEDFMVGESLFEFLTRKTADGWEILAMLPTATLDPSLESLAGCSLQLSFGRYDYANEQSEPILSSTSKHEVLNFHRVHEWTVVDLVGES